jgi:hypothetical protein
LINMSWRYFTWQHGGGLIVGDDLPAGPTARNAPASRQSTDHASTDPTPGSPEPG